MSSRGYDSAYPHMVAVDLLTKLQPTSANFD
jgi:hypothetical protein